MSWDQSKTARVLRALEKQVTGVSDGSVFVETAKSVATRGEALVRNSYCYRWLTAEPDPEVIVIDLRETHTVGPFVRLLEKGIGPVERAWANSGLESVTTGLGSAISNSRTGRLLIALLEPPEPPESERENYEERE